MTDSEILQVIDGNPALVALANAGNDTELSIRLSDGRFRKVISYRITDISILGAFANPRDGEIALEHLETIANADGLVRRVLSGLSNPDKGVDVGDARVRGMLDLLGSNAQLPFTRAEATAIKALAEVPDVVSVDRVSNILLPRRTALQAARLARLESRASVFMAQNPEMPRSEAMERADQELFGNDWGHG